MIVGKHICYILLFAVTQAEVVHIDTILLRNDVAINLFLSTVP